MLFLLTTEKMYNTTVKKNESIDSRDGITKTGNK